MTNWLYCIAEENHPDALRVEGEVGSPEEALEHFQNYVGERDVIQRFTRLPAINGNFMLQAEIGMFSLTAMEVDHKFLQYG